MNKGEAAKHNMQDSPWPQRIIQSKMWIVPREIDGDILMLPLKW
jgi:hypothetical protein